MNTRNAWGFLLCGLGMFLGPALEPGHFPDGTLTGVSSELWLDFMGWVNLLLGGGYLALRQLADWFRRAPGWQQVRVAEANELARPELPKADGEHVLSERPAAA